MMISTTAAAREDKLSGVPLARHVLARWSIPLLVGSLVVAMTLLVLEHLGHTRGAIQPHPMHFDAAAFDTAVIRDYLVANGMAGRVRAVVVHFRDGSCPCSTLGDARFLALRTRHVGEDVIFATAEAPRGSNDPVRGLERLPRLPPDAAARLWAALPASPALAVFDGHGVPIFLGPYAEGAHCSAAHGGRAEAALAGIGADGGVPTPPGEAAGCMCDTRGRTSVATPAGQPADPA